MDYVSVRTSTVRGDAKLSFNLYILLNQKYILYIRSGDFIETARLEKLKEKKLKKLWIESTDESQYRDFLSINLAAAYDKNSTKTSDQKADIAQGIQQANAEEVMENPQNEAAYNSAKNDTAKFVDLLMREDKVISHVLKIENTDQNLAHHGVTVSTLAVAVAQKLGITDEKILKILSLGALLHDMGHTKIDTPYMNPLSQMTPDQLKLYKTHPTVGAELVKDKQHFDQQVITIIAQHEEYADGSGYPNGLTDKKMDKLSLITGVANAYDRLVTFEKLPPKDAMKNLMIEKMGRYPLDHLNAVKAVLLEQKVI